MRAGSAGVVRARSVGQGQECHSEEHGARSTLEPGCKPTGLGSL